MKLIHIATVGAALMGTSVTAQDAKRVYDQGPIGDVTHVKVEPGQLNAYMENLNGLWRRSMDDAKRWGEVLDYRVYTNMAAGKDEPDLLLVTTYRNAAVMDTSLDELDRRTAAMQSSITKANQATIARGKLRTILGNDLYRELTFKDK